MPAQARQLPTKKEHPLSQYTIDEVLSMMESWVSQHKELGEFDETMPFKGFDGLRGQNLSGIDLSEDAIQSKAQTWADNEFPGSGSRPPWFWFAHADAGINLGGADLSPDADGKRTNLTGAHLEGANLGGAHLERADLFGVYLEGAHLGRAHLESADLLSAHLERADLFGAHLDGARLSRAHLEWANLIDAHLESAGLEGAHLEGANFGGAHLQGANLRWAHLQGADLGVADLKGTDFREANLAGVRLANTEISPETSFYDADWGKDHKLGDEIDRDWEGAAAAYRTLRLWHENAGLYSKAREFHYREMSLDTRVMWRDGWNRFRRQSRDAWNRFRRDIAEAIGSLRDLKSDVDGQR